MKEEDSAIGDDFKFIAVYNLRGNTCTIREKKLHEYFIQKSESMVTKELLLKKRRGVAYTKSASGYIFSRVS